jgi:hypothetical protein
VADLTWAEKVRRIVSVLTEDHIVTRKSEADTLDLDRLAEHILVAIGDANS